MSPPARTRPTKSPARLRDSHGAVPATDLWLRRATFQRQRE